MAANPAASSVRPASTNVRYPVPANANWLPLTSTALTQFRSLLLPRLDVTTLTILP